MDTYKVLFHFRDRVPELAGFYVEVEATSWIDALRKVSDKEWWLKYWNGKKVCVNMQNVSYLEVADE